MPMFTRIATLLLAFIGLQLVMTQLIALLVHVFITPEEPIHQLSATHLSLALLLANLLMIPVVFFVRPRISQAHAFRVREIALALLASLPVIVLTNLFVEFLGVDNTLEEIFLSMRGNLLSVVCMTIVVPICEEFVFRYGILGIIYSRTRSATWAILLSAVLFGAIHLNPAQSIGAAALGAFLGYVYIRCHSIVAPIAVHILNNSIAVLTLHYPELEQSLIRWIT